MDRYRLIADSDSGISAKVDTTGSVEYSEKSPLLQVGKRTTDNNNNIKEKWDRDRREKSKSDLQLFLTDSSSFSKSTSTSASLSFEKEKGHKLKNGLLGGNLRKYRGIILAILSCFIQSFTPLLAKYLEHYHTFNVSLWRFQLILILSVPVFIHHLFWGETNSTKKCKYNSLEELNKPSKFKTGFFLILRSFTGCTAIILRVYALQYIDIGDATAITFTTPVFVGILSHWFLREKFGIVPIFTAVITVIGVIVITRPPFLSQTFDSKQFIGVGLALGCMAFLTVTMITTRFLRHTSFALITFVYGVYSVLQCMVCALIVSGIEYPQNGKDWLLAIAFGVVGFAGQSLIILAMKYEKAGPVSAMTTTEVIFTFLWQIIFLNQLPDVFSIVGTLTIVLALVIIAVRKWIEELPEEHSLRRRLWFLLK